MPYLPSWARKVNEILEVVESSDIQVFERRSIESLFQVKKSVAVTLMGRIGGLGRIGTSQSVDRRHLLLFLHKVQIDPRYGAEAARLERVEKKLEAERRDLSARRHIIPVERHIDVAIDGLPGVLLQHGQLTIDFWGTEDLLRKLYELSQAIVQDWNRFEKLAEEL